MKTSKTTVWKVVKVCFDGRLTSVLAYDTVFERTYTPGKTVRFQVFPGFVFATMTTASSFLQDMYSGNWPGKAEVWKADATVIQETIVSTCTVEALKEYPEEVKNFWRQNCWRDSDWRAMHSYTGDPPRGTMLCKTIKLLERGYG